MVTSVFYYYLQKEVLLEQTQGHLTIHQHEVTQDVGLIDRDAVGWILECLFTISVIITQRIRRWLLEINPTGLDCSTDISLSIPPKLHDILPPTLGSHLSSRIIFSNTIKQDHTTKLHLYSIIQMKFSHKHTCTHIAHTHTTSNDNSHGPYTLGSTPSFEVTRGATTFFGFFSICLP